MVHVISWQTEDNFSILTLEKRVATIEINRNVSHAFHFQEELF